MKKREITEAETALYAEVFLLGHIQLAAVQKRLGPGQNAIQRWRFRRRHRKIQRLLNSMFELKGGSREDAEKSIEQDFEFMRSGKKGWSYISVGEIEYLEGLLKGI
jgi:hypothetical protein